MKRSIGAVGGRSAATLWPRGSDEIRVPAPASEVLQFLLPSGALAGSARDPRLHRGSEDPRQLTAITQAQALETVRQEPATPAIDVIAVTRTVASIVEYDSPSASIIGSNLRTAHRRSNSARSSAVNVNAVWRQNITSDAQLSTRTGSCSRLSDVRQPQLSHFAPQLTRWRDSES